MEDPRSRVSGTSLRFEEALGLGEYQNTAPVQIGLQPSGAGNRTYLKKKMTPNGDGFAGLNRDKEVNWPNSRRSNSRFQRIR